MLMLIIQRQLISIKILDLHDKLIFMKLGMREFIVNLIINKPAFILNESSYFTYIITLSKILSKIGIAKSLRARIIFPFPDINFPLYEISQGNRSFLIQSKYRVSRLISGFERAAERQWERYNFENILKNEIPDVLIDVGANIGEFSFAANSRNINRIIAIEPDFIARRCLEVNLLEAKIEILPVALGENYGLTSFYLNTETADSSLEPSVHGSMEVKVQMKTLDILEKELNLKGKFALKMDAEGFEIEVLKGSTEFLKSVHWISIDGGPERNGQVTHPSIVNYLENFGFKIINVDKFGIVSARK